MKKILKIGFAVKDDRLELRILFYLLFRPLGIIKSNIL